MRHLILPLTWLLLVFPLFTQDSPVVHDHVTRVVDGDTVILQKIGRARLIGVDTPETVHPQESVEYFGKEASKFTRKMLEGEWVRVEFDWEKRDRYGRALVYLFLEDGTFFNAELIKQGYAHAYTQFPFKYLEEFRKYEREAREQGRGLWGDPGPESEATADSEIVYHGNQRSHVFHAPGCRHYDCKNCTVSLTSKAEAVRRGFRPHGDCVR